MPTLRERYMQAKQGAVPSTGGSLKERYLAAKNARGASEGSAGLPVNPSPLPAQSGLPERVRAFNLAGQSRPQGQPAITDPGLGGQVKRGLGLLADVGKPVGEYFMEQGGKTPWPIAPDRDLTAQPLTTDEINNARAWAKANGATKLLAILDRTANRFVGGTADFVTQTGSRLVNPEKYQAEGPSGSGAGFAMNSLGGLLQGVQDLPAQAGYLSQEAFGSGNPITPALRAGTAVLNLPGLLAGQSAGDLERGAVNRLYEAPESPLIAAGVAGGVGRGLSRLRPRTGIEAQNLSRSEFIDRTLAEDRAPARQSAYAYEQGPTPFEQAEQQAGSAELAVDRGPTRGPINQRMADMEAEANQRAMNRQLSETRKAKQPPGPTVPETPDPQLEAIRSASRVQLMNEAVNLGVPIADVVKAPVVELQYLVSGGRLGVARESSPLPEVSSVKPEVVTPPIATKPAAEFTSLERSKPPAKLPVDEPVTADVSREAKTVPSAEKPPSVQEIPTTEPETAAPPASVKAKEAWEMTREEFDKSGDVMFHGTTNAADIQRVGFKKGWTHLTDSKEIADSYRGWARGDSPATLRVSFKPKNPAIFDAKGFRYTDHEANLSYRIHDAAYKAEKAGHDALIVRNIRDNYDSSAPTEPHTTVIAFDPSAVKVVNHRTTIEQALSEGLPVPASVLADYPDLAAKYGKVTESQPAAAPLKETAPASLPKAVEGVKTTTNPTIKAKLPKEEVSPFLQKVDDMEAAAWERIKERSKKTTLGMGGLQELPNFADIVIIGAAKIARGTVRFSEWSAEMIRDLGDDIKPHLRKLYAGAHEHLKGELAIHTDQINLDRLNVGTGAKSKITKAVEDIRGELEEIKGDEPLSNAEVLEAAKGSEILRKVSTREQTLESEAAALRARQHLAALSEEQGSGLTKDFIEALKVVSADATRKGRELQALGIEADPSLGNIKSKIVKKLLDMGKSVDEIIAAAEGVDFTNAEQVTQFYRKYVPPELKEWIDEYRYINLLSSPKTHIVNAFSNLLQAAAVRPATRFASGVVDNVASALTKRQQVHYVRQVPAYYRGMTNAVGDAAAGALDVFKGKSLIERPDIAQIPTGSKLLKPFMFVPRALEAGDVFFRTLIEAGEREALTKGQQLGAPKLSEAKIGKQSKETAAYTIFRGDVDAANKTGQGHVLAGIDKMTQAVYTLRRVPGVKWFVPFVRTPMNIFKQGIEYSPFGYTTMFGSKFKVEQFAKATVGSTVFAGTATLGLQGRLTWATPTRKEEREAFFASGRQPYAVKIGDKWVSYSRLGPLAYPMAMAAAVQYHVNESPHAATDTQMEKTTRVLTGIAEYFSDQSYVEGIGEFVKAVSGEPGAAAQTFANVPSQLIPLSSLQRWTAQLIDPVYRRRMPGLSTRAIVENLKSGIPGLSKDLPPYTTPGGKPSMRQMPWLNAFSPLQTAEAQPVGELAYRQAVKKSAERFRKDKERESGKTRPTRQVRPGR